MTGSEDAGLDGSIRSDAGRSDAGPPLDAGPTLDASPLVDGDADTRPRDQVTADCEFYSARRGAFIPLNGDVEFVDAFADFQVEEVTAFADLHVELVDAFPNACGEWREVTAFPDFTVEIVTAFPDFEIEYVTAFPGLP